MNNRKRIKLLHFPYRTVSVDKMTVLMAGTGERHLLCKQTKRKYQFCSCLFTPFHPTEQKFETEKSIILVLVFIIIFPLAKSKFLDLIGGYVHLPQTPKHHRSTTNKNKLKCLLVCVNNKYFLDVATLSMLVWKLGKVISVIILKNS